MPLICCILGFCVLFFISDIFDDLEDFLEVRAPLAGILQYFLMRQPVNFVHILPMSILLSISFMMSGLARHGELTALRSAGLSLPRSALPMWMIGIIAAGALLWLNETVVPEFEHQTEVLQEELTNKDGRPLEEETLLAFRYSQGNRDWFFEKFSKEGPQFGVSIKQFSQDGAQRLKWELRAEQAIHQDGVWIFKNARKWRYSEDSALPSVDGPDVMKTYVAEDLSETPAEINNSLKPLEELSSAEMLGILRSKPNLPASTKQVFRTTLWYRIALPLSCLVASLLGVGLTGRGGRASALRGFAAALGLMVLYHVTAQLFVVMGKNAVVPPFIGGMGPPLAFIFYGISAVYKRR